MPITLVSALAFLMWLIALSTVMKALAAMVGIPKLPNLLTANYDRTPEGNPTLTVVVPARNEQNDVEACLRSLLQQDCPHLQILAVDDRSTDRTGVLMDGLAAAYPQRLSVLHITELAEGWLGKNHAMAKAAAATRSEYLLFTDADVIFRSDSLRRSLVYARESGADHVITMPTAISHRWDEAALLGFFQILGLWGAPVWRVAEPRSRTALGIGAFNLVRRSAYEAIGGFEALRMEIVEDVSFGRRIKQAGLAQRAAFGRGLVCVHWASGANGIVNVMTKNLFSAFRFSIPLVLLGCGWLAGCCIAPFVLVFYPPTLIPAGLIVISLAVKYRLLSPHSGISGWNVLLAPFAAMVFVYAIAKSTVTTLRQGGVIWRGTFYPLAELRRHVPPFR
jgi:GT2 family glycosyltransferase